MQLPIRLVLYTIGKQPEGGGGVGAADEDDLRSPEACKGVVPSINRIHRSIVSYLACSSLHFIGMSDKTRNAG